MKKKNKKKKQISRIVAGIRAIMMLCLKRHCVIKQKKTCIFLAFTPYGTLLYSLLIGKLLNLT